ncbi:hypothetical protein BX600DRAFT_504822 [Xylariales sp. PMI_506]|nr:hypothetical protein BX600DRAFT_504822 [Xylariales sp. PMI_506]
MSLAPVVLSPALPSELLTYILHHHVYPTTLIVCSTRDEFLDSLLQDLRHQATTPQSSSEPEADAEDADMLPREVGRLAASVASEEKHPLLSSPLYQVCISRHVRTVYVPTVTHLRAYLSIFSPADSRIRSPPSTAISLPGSGRRRRTQKPPHLVVYGLVALHRNTSEWSGQGLGTTAAALVDTAHRLGWGLVVVEPRQQDGFEGLLGEAMPILNGGWRRAGVDSEERPWSGRTVEVGRVMSRWFRYQRGSWDRDDTENIGHT